MGRKLLIGLAGLWLAGCTAYQKRTPEQEAYVRAVEAETTAMAEATQSLDPHASEAFLERYPNTLYREAIMHHLQDLERKKKEKIIDPEEEYRATRTQDTIEAYQGYLFRHGREDKHYAEAFARLDELLHPGGRLSVNMYPSEVVITAGPLAQPYSALGEVNVNTIGMINLGSILNDALFRSPIQRAVQGPTPTAHTETLNEMLRTQARQQFGSQVDAVVNVTYRTDPDGDVYASGLAVRFVDPQPVSAPVAQGPTLEQKLTELKTLREKNLITPEEYYEKRSELLKGL